MFIKSKNIETPHAFSTKFAGNLWLINDKFNKEAMTNLLVFSKNCKVPINKLAYGNQIHKNNIAVISNKDFKDSNISINDNCDGLITKQQGVSLAIFTADCAPCLMYEPNTKIICAIHCGWKPVAADIVGQAINLIKTMGGSSKNIQAAIGPCIHKCCFNVGQEVKDKFINLLGNDAKSCIYENTIDLAYAVALRLKQLGVLNKNIDIINECTSCNNNKYYSYRKGDKANARLLSIIYLN